MENYQVDREDVVLLLLESVERFLGRELRGITRLEKLVFLLAKEEKVEPAMAYDFRAYKFGPFSKDIYQATDFLRGIELISVGERSVVSYYNTNEELALEGLIDDDEAPAIEQKEKVFSLTERGRTAAHSLRTIWAKDRPADLAKIEGVVKRYARLPLNQLIRYVYRQFPDFAKNSIHPEAGRLPGA